MSTKVKLSLVERIVAFLKLNDAGKIQSFFDSETKNCKVQIKKLESNLKQLDLQNEIELEELERKIEDAETAVDDAYLNVDVEKIKTNADKDAFAKTYWGKIKSADATLTYLKEEHVEKLKAIKEKKEEIAKQIAAYNVRIDKLNS